MAVLELEAQGDSLLRGGSDEFAFLFVVVEIEGDIQDFGGIGKVAGDAVEEDLDALVLVGGAHEDGDELLGDAALSDGGHEHFIGEFAVEVGFGQFVGEHGGGFDELLAVTLGVGHEVGGDVGVAEVLAGGTVEVHGLHLHEVDDAFQLVLEPDGDGDEGWIESEFLLQLRLDLEGVGAGAVALVDEGEARYVVALELAVDGDGLGLHARHRAEHKDGAVEDAQGTLDLDREVDVSRRIDQVDRVILPLHVGRGGLDRDAALALEIHGVHGGSRPILALHFVDGMDLLAVEENAFGQCRLARVDMGGNPDVSHQLNVCGHLVPSPHCDRMAGASGRPMVLKSDMWQHGCLLCGRL